MGMGANAIHSKDGDQQQVIAFLSDPASYGCRGPVERIDTHAAIVFLAGDRAYKLKRAVRYPYLDFSTPTARRNVCEAELALNRRTAADLYIEVRPIGRRRDGSLAFGAGRPVDWVVVMNRLAPGSLMSEIARAGTLDPVTMRELAEAIARFHERADVVPGKGAQRVREVIEGNRISMAALPGAILPPDQCHQLCIASLAMAEELSALLDSRADAGLVRHCHGDLHLANICMWQGRPTLFDCLEFSPRLATSDVLYDLAFLLMDLWQGGHRGEASLVFNRYCDLRGESSGIAALPLFLSMRAAVRAHAEGSSAARQEGAAAREEKLAAARKYLASALLLLTRPQARLIAVGGLSGSGKSTLAGRLAPLVGSAPGARWLRTDVLRKQLAGVAPETHLPESAYTPASHAAVYAALCQKVRETLAAGWPVIVDAVFDFPETRLGMDSIAASVGVPFTGLWLEASREALHARVRGRKGDASDAGTEVVDKQLQRDIGQLGAWRKVDASGSAAQTLARALDLIEIA